MRRVYGLALAAIAAGGFAAAFGFSAQAADKPAPDKPSLKQLLAQGYDIKAVTFIPQDAIKGMGMDPATTVPQILVTLQKNSGIAVCQIAAENWTVMAAQSIEGKTQCDTYK